MANSILQINKECCYLCGMNTNLEPLDCHHQLVFGGSNRKISEQYGLKVYLHHKKCHIFGKESVHQNAKINNRLKAEAQEAAMIYYGWSKDEFRQIFGKNYL